MDFFDVDKQKRHTIRLGIGYTIIGLAIVLATTVLLYQAYGYGLDKNGRVIQNGLVFVSSHPSGADIYVNGAKYKDGTNTRMNLPSGQYLMQLKRQGYQTWKRILTVEGGSLERFDYPFLLPASLVTTAVKQYPAAPLLGAQSPDRRWLLVGTAEQNIFELYDLNQKKPIPQTISLSTDILAAGSTSTGWQLVDWAKDNRHLLLRRSFDRSGQAGSEYILVDSQDPALSQNLSIILGFTPTTIELRDRAYDQYYLYDQSSAQLFTASLKQPTPQPYLSGVLNFASEGDVVAYVTAQNSDIGKVSIRIKQKNDQPMTARQVPVGTTYLLDLAVYEGKLYLAAGASSENRVFVYKDPVGLLKNKSTIFLAPVQILKVNEPTYVTFSLNKRFVIAENADHFAVYDAETDRGYAYQAGAPLDSPQSHASWMDGFRLCYVSGGKLVVFDFDGINLQTLTSASPDYLPFFDRNYRFVYTLDANNALSSTALLVSQDL